MKLPAKIKIGYRSYEIHPWCTKEAELHNAKGQTWGDQGWIRLDETLDTEQTANSFIHEMLHGMWKQCDLPDDVEEHFVTVLANQLTQVFQDNPEVTKYLKAALDPKRKPPPIKARAS